MTEQNKTGLNGQDSDQWDYHLAQYRKSGEAVIAAAELELKQVRYHDFWFGVRMLALILLGIFSNYLILILF